jgi:hypothetical protein
MLLKPQAYQEAVNQSRHRCHSGSHGNAFASRGSQAHRNDLESSNRPRGVDTSEAIGANDDVVGSVGCDACVAAGSERRSFRLHAGHEEGWPRLPAMPRRREFGALQSQDREQLLQVRERAVRNGRSTRGRARRRLGSRAVCAPADRHRLQSSIAPGSQLGCAWWSDRSRSNSHLRLPLQLPPTLDENLGPAALA